MVDHTVVFLQTFYFSLFFIQALVVVISVISRGACRFHCSCDVLL